MAQRVLSLIMLGTLASRSEAQQVQIQQPVVQLFGLETTVSVPDRGAVFLGGVGSSSGAGGTYGPLPYGTSSGGTTSSSSVWASVTIHDLTHLDQLVLAEGARRLATSGTTLSRDLRVQLLQRKQSQRSAPHDFSDATHGLARQQALSILKNRR